MSENAIQKSVLVLGGYGNFGKRIATELSRHCVPVIIAGRSREKAEALAAELPRATAAAFDITKELPAQLEALRPVAVINTCGPFQTSNYDVARACIAQGVHYIDLADGREFVTGITALDEEAKQHNVSVISGASTVPALSSAVIEHFRNEFSQIDSLVYGISPGQKAERGLATTQGILTYVGKPLKPFPGSGRFIYGWQDLYLQRYPGLGMRWMANCDIPDLDLLPARYDIVFIRFSAGMELGILHLGLWLLSWLVRMEALFALEKYAPFLLKLSNLFNCFGSPHGGMHMILQGKGSDGKPHTREWFIIARDGDGPQIPCVPAILLAKRLAAGKDLPKGAYPCMGLVTLPEYLAELRRFSIKTY